MRMLLPVLALRFSLENKGQELENTGRAIEIKIPIKRLNAPIIIQRYQAFLPLDQLWTYILVALSVVPSMRSGTAVSLLG
jgi:hypothetical protein